MLGAHAQRSEVERLLTQMSSEHEAACRDLFESVQGMSRPDSFLRCMETRAILHEQLHDLVGDAAVAMVADQLSANVRRGAE